MSEDVLVYSSIITNGECNNTSTNKASQDRVGGYVITYYVRNNLITSVVCSIVLDTLLFGQTVLEGCLAYRHSRNNTATVVTIQVSAGDEPTSLEVES